MRTLATIVAALVLPLAMARPAAADVDVAAVWKKNCNGCHGSDGKADTDMGHKQKIEDMSTDKWQKEFTDEKIKDVIANGVKKADGTMTKMKAFKEKLKPEEIDALVKYVRAFKK